MRDILDELVGAIGQVDALKFIETFGGTRIYLPLPENVDAGNQIAKAIGIEPARALARLWAQCYVDVPMTTSRLLRDEIRRDREHMTVRQIARKYKTHERSIWRLLAK